MCPYWVFTQHICNICDNKEIYIHHYLTHSVYIMMVHFHICQIRHTVLAAPLTAMRKFLTSSNLRTGGLTSAYSVGEIQSIIMRKTWWREQEPSGSHCVESGSRVNPEAELS